MKDVFSFRAEPETIKRYRAFIRYSGMQPGFFFKHAINEYIDKQEIKLNERSKEDVKNTE